jgi:CubicO group peptidase (beta-lactamase class C family)
MDIRDIGLNDTIEKTAETINFSGLVSIADQDGLVFEKAYGFADRSHNIPNAVNTRFGTASGTKFFTALGIGRLVDAGEIKLDSRLCDMVSHEFPNFSKTVTIEHLLTHTSGVFDYYDEELVEDFDNFYVEIPWYHLTTPSNYLPLFQNKGMKFDPGARFSYSNGGYILLGIIIEEVTGQLYRDFILDQVFQPCGMTDSGFFPLNQLPEGTASGYMETSGGRWRTNIFNLPIIGASDGGAYTKAANLRKLWAAFTSHQLLSPKLTVEFQKVHAKVYKDELGYGYGLYIWRKYDPSAYFIVGSDAGVGFDSRHWSEKDLTISILSNQTDGEVEIRNAIYGCLEAAGWA